MDRVGGGNSDRQSGIVMGWFSLVWAGLGWGLELGLGPEDSLGEEREVPGE